MTEAAEREPSAGGALHERVARAEREPSTGGALHERVARAEHELVARAEHELVARAEHELRGAATALALVCEAVRRDPRARRHAPAIDAQLDRLRAGLGDLAAARGGLTAGGEVEEVELPALVRAAVAPWAQSRAGRGAAFDWDGEPGVARLDRRRLMKALGNVVANAAEHGDGDIHVTGERHDGRIRVEVRNRGRGLRIAAAAAEELGGRLSFEIDGEDAVATLELPAA